MNLQPNLCRPRQNLWNVVETQVKHEQKQGQLRNMYALSSSFTALFSFKN